MNLGGIAMILVISCAAIFGLILIMSHSNMGAPVDSYGNTTSMQENLTRSNVTATGATVSTLGGWVVFIVAVLFLFGVVVILRTMS